MIVRKQNQLEMKMVELGWIGKINKTFVTVRCPDRALPSNLVSHLSKSGPPLLSHPFLPPWWTTITLLQWKGSTVPFQSMSLPLTRPDTYKESLYRTKNTEKKNTSWQVINIWTLIIKHCTFRNQWTIHFGLLTVKLPTIWTSFWNGNAAIEKHRTILQKSD